MDKRPLAVVSRPDGADGNLRLGLLRVFFVFFAEDCPTQKIFVMHSALEKTDGERGQTYGFGIAGRKSEDIERAQEGTLDKRYVRRR